MLTNKGFTLIEVLVVLVILSLIFVPLILMFNQSLFMGEEAGLRTRLIYLNSGKLEILKSLEYEELEKFIGKEGTWQKATSIHNNHENIEELTASTLLEKIEFYHYYELLEKEYVGLSNGKESDLLEEDEKEDNNKNFELKKMVLIKSKIQWQDSNSEIKENVLITKRAYKTKN